MASEGTPARAFPRLVLALPFLAACSVLFPMDGYSDPGAQPLDASSDAARDAGGDASSDCNGTSPVYRVQNPETGDVLFTLNQSEASNAVAAYGYTDLRVAFRAYPTKVATTTPVFRLLDPVAKVRFYTPFEDEKPSARGYGYTSDEGAAFFVPRNDLPCGTPVRRLQRAHVFTLAFASEEIDGLVAQGWTDGGVKFFAGFP